MHMRRKIILTIVIIAFIFAGVLLFAPRFLIYSSPSYRKADTVILFLGPDFTARQKEAYRIISEGMADYLIIPAYHKIYRVLDDGNIKHLSANLISRKAAKKNSAAADMSFYEDTHIEAMEAKKIMTDFGLKSAVFVSSPYHMRRIKLIVAEVFAGESGEFYFSPTRYEKAPGEFWKLSLADWKKVGWEYIKMIWFSLYIHWVK